MGPHARSQILRFLRVSAMAFVASLFTTGGKIGWSSLWAMVAGAGETGLRQVWPVKPVLQVSSVLADPEPPADSPAAKS